MGRVPLKRRLAILMGVTLTLTGWAVAQEPAPTAIAIEGFAFKPGLITISPGVEVVWTNKDGPDHTVTARNRSFDSGALSQGKTFKTKFARPGTFDYACEFHPDMTGRVVVK